MAISIGITLIAVGVLFLVWSTVLRDRRTADTIGEELERTEETNRELESAISTADSTCEQLAGTVGHLQDTVGKLAESVDTSEEIFEQIRKQRCE